MIIQTQFLRKIFTFEDEKNIYFLFFVCTPQGTEKKHINEKKGKSKIFFSIILDTNCYLMKKFKNLHFMYYSEGLLANSKQFNHFGECEFKISINI